MFVRNITFFILILIVSCTMEDPKNGFDSACLIFKEASTKQLSPDELGSYIAGELDKMDVQPASENVKEIYHALFNVAPEDRYGLFKESAETTLNRKWDCDAMKMLYR